MECLKLLNSSSIAGKCLDQQTPHLVSWKATTCVQAQGQSLNNTLQGKRPPKPHQTSFPSTSNGGRRLQISSTLKPSSALSRSAKTLQATRSKLAENPSTPKFPAPKKAEKPSSPQNWALNATLPPWPKTAEAHAKPRPGPILPRKRDRRRLRRKVWTNNSFYSWWCSSNRRINFRARTLLAQPSRRSLCTTRSLTRWEIPTLC